MTGGPAPLPWRVKAQNKHYLSIIDAEGVAICELFPFARPGGRGWEVTETIAERIVVLANTQDQRRD